ncbi:PepSY domain-containing protein [Psychrosphaera haliotis]|nr:PepSY domain-containing protein [Psychrosphaera haliotis]
MKSQLPRKIHKWLMLFVGLQVFIWSATGLYMVMTNIHYIHGEHLQKPSPVLNVSSLKFNHADVLKSYPNADSISLFNRVGEPVFLVQEGRESALVNATTKELMPKVTEQEAREIALFQFHDSAGVIANISYLKDSAPSELSARHLPVWEVQFEGIASPTFYISESSGQVVTKRHNPWRIFDWFWRFHIMDYLHGEDVGNVFFLVVSITTLLSTLAGCCLVYQRVLRNFVQSSVRKFANKWTKGRTTHVN